MNTNLPHLTVSRIILAGAALVLAAIPCGCTGGPTTATADSATVQLAGDICDRTMTLDVSGPYYQSCRNYIARVALAPTGSVPPSRNEPAEHQACMRAGLAEGTPAYGKCVQAMEQLDISSIHL